jgi:SpoVK/Ycf46/Vps4 family AAA+-type ATPase
VPASTAPERTALWERALDGHADGVDVVGVTTSFRLRPEQVARAARTAVVQAGLAADGRVTAAHLRYGARAENGTALDRLARRVDPAVGWDDLVLPDGVLLALREVALRARHRERVLGDWRMRPGGGRGQGVAALFAGDSGTGKTMSAEVVAHDLGLDLYVVDLATVVDKYVGETEKNLERIFTAAAGVNGVLLFDEADAVFGKRSEVRDAHDRYANVESAYLLQRMETFDGLVILATNLRANIDEAFTRRLDVVVDFPLPDVPHRRALWDACLGRAMRRADGIDLDFCALAFELAGGAIRSAAVTAAYLAAEDEGDLTMRHVVNAVQREYRKLGRLTLQSEFGAYWGLLG